MTPSKLQRRDRRRCAQFVLVYICTVLLLLLGAPSTTAAQVKVLQDAPAARRPIHGEIASLFGGVSMDYFKENSPKKSAHNVRELGEKVNHHARKPVDGMVPSFFGGVSVDHFEAESRPTAEEDERDLVQNVNVNKRKPVDGMVASLLGGISMDISEADAGSSSDEVGRNLKQRIVPNQRRPVDGMVSSLFGGIPLDYFERNPKPSAGTKSSRKAGGSLSTHIHHEARRHNETN